MSMPALHKDSLQRQQTVTQYLRAMSEGDVEALDGLMPFVYDELRALAQNKLRFERADHTLSATALVHEAYERLVDQHRVNWQGRTHFFAIAAQAMRRILVNYAAKRKAAKRGGQAPHVPLDETFVFTEERSDQLLALDEALTLMEAFNERGCRVVEYRFFGGLTHEEIADMMGLSVRTVERSWKMARQWLRMEMNESET
jgi:RNA polymerase sigma factor (TIGR02999 family)